MTPESLAWPPRKEDLERMYIGLKTSAAKIAEAYGLKYASPKTAESTVFYHLERNGIARRDRADLVRKVTGATAAEWERRYRAGESYRESVAENEAPKVEWQRVRDEIRSNRAGFIALARNRLEG
jgi:hypothetical protein